MKHTETYSACVDCYYFAANGHADDTDAERRAEIERAFDDAGAYLTAGDDLSEFSRNPCELCGSHLAGSRHEVHKLEN